MQIFEVGPVIERVQVQVPDELREYLLGHALEVPAPRVTGALVDTGASQTQIDIGIVMALKLQPIAQTTIHRCDEDGTGQPYFVYDASFCITEDDGTRRVWSIPVIGCPVTPTQRCGMVLGRDVLNEGTLVYDGPRRRCVLQFPPAQRR
jgi:hypothetical protein